MFLLAIGMYLVTFDLILKKRKEKKIGAGANFGEGGPEKQLFFFTMALCLRFFLYILPIFQLYREGFNLLCVY